MNREKRLESASHACGVSVAPRRNPYGGRDLTIPIAYQDTVTDANGTKREIKIPAEYDPVTAHDFEEVAPLPNGDRVVLRWPKGDEN